MNSNKNEVSKEILNIWIGIGMFDKSKSFTKWNKRKSITGGEKTFNYSRNQYNGGKKWSSTIKETNSNKSIDEHNFDGMQTIINLETNPSWNGEHSPKDMESE